MRLSISILFFSTFLLIGCTNKNESFSPIPEESFIRLYADVLVIREESALAQTDSLPERRKTDSLCTIYGVTRAQFDLTLADKKKDLRQWKEFYEKVAKRLDSLQQQQSRK